MPYLQLLLTGVIVELGSKKAKVLIAGATGYLGKFVVCEFKKRGYWVRALARTPQKLNSLKVELDEVVEGDATVPESILDACNGIDVVFSSIGITKQKGKFTFRDVDYQGNKNLLEIAQKAGVKKFIYVSVFNGPELLHLDIVKAHEDFVAELKASGMNYAVIRPTGYFSDMGEFFNMAGKGRVYLFGVGNSKINPIHGADLAVICADAVEGVKQEIDIGGPEIFSWQDIAKLAFEAQGKPVKISSIPVWLMNTVASITKIFNKHAGELMAFFITMGTSDVVAAPTGTHSLRTYYKESAGHIDPEIPLADIEA